MVHYGHATALSVLLFLQSRSSNCPKGSHFVNQPVSFAHSRCLEDRVYVWLTYPIYASGLSPFELLVSTWVLGLLGLSNLQHTMVLRARTVFLLRTASGKVHSLYETM